MESVEEELARLREENRTLRSLLDNAPDIVARFDRMGRHLYVNRGVERYSLQPASCFFGKTNAELGMPAHLVVEWNDLIADAFDGHEQEAEFDFPGPEGQRHFQMRVVPERDEAGKVVAAISIARDITEIHQGRSEFEAQRQLLRLIIDQAPAGICFVDRDLVYRWVNPAFLRLLGVDLAHMIGRSLEEAFPEGAEQLAPLLRRVVETGEPHHGFGFPWRFVRDGKEVVTYWDFTYQPVVGPDGVPLGILTTANEVSERIERERLQETQMEALREADRLKDDFLTILSHELRTPLNYIMGFASVLDDGLLGDMPTQQHEALDKILAGSEQMLGLVEILIDMSRLRAGKLLLVQESVDVAEAVHEVVAEATPAADAKGLRVDVALPADLPTADVDPRRLRQMVGHLVKNAVAFTPPGGRVQVSAAQVGDRLRMMVTDSGPGIPKASRATIFEPFTQVDTSSTRAKGGLGLGLSLVKGLVEAHGGAVGLDEAPEGGAAFWLTLPLAGA